MSRKVLGFALLLLSLSAYAKTRAVTPPFVRPGGGSISGIVESVEGNLIRLADGLIVVDASKASIVIGRGRVGTIAEIEPGMLLFASTAKDEQPSSHPVLHASTIVATHAGDAGISGAVQSVDVTTRSFVVLGHTIYVDDDTSFGGFLRNGQPGLSDVVPNQLVTVQVDAVSGRLVARDVLVLSPVPPQISRLNGTVKSIGTDAWTIESDGETVTVVVNAQTKIVGSPKVGDRVEVILNIDTANNRVAIAIYKIQIVTPPVKIVQFHGKVKSITGPTWVVTADGQDKTFTVNERTKVTPNTGVGNLVQVLASQADDGTLTAMTVIKLGF